MSPRVALRGGRRGGNTYAALAYGRRGDYQFATYAIRLEPGRCRWCGCTYHDPCDGGCGWATRDQTLCTACVELDRLVSTVAGRKLLAAMVQDAR